jgi:antimicrobial peptide system SdpA family protein
MSDSKTSPAGPAAVESPRPRAVGAKALVTGTVAALFALSVIAAAVPGIGLRLPFMDRLHMSSVMPQGWVFFTLPPRTPRLEVFRRGDGGWVREPTTVSAEPSNLSGWSRANRARDSELAAIVGQIPSSAFARCQVIDDACAAGRPVPLTNPYRVGPSFCGELLIVLQAPPRWAAGGQDPAPPPVAVRAVVSCSA